VDPVLVSWVPEWVVEQYERWNPYFRRCVKDALDHGLPQFEEWRRRTLRELLLRQGDPEDEAERRASRLRPRRRVWTNARLLTVVRRDMERLEEKAAAEKARGDAAGADGSGSEESGEDSSSDDDDPEAGAARARRRPCIAILGRPLATMA